MAEDEVGGTIDEAHDKHEAKADDPGATTGQANEPAEEGFQPPESGSEGAPESEIPTGVDELTDEQIAKAEEAGPADGGDEGDGGALDVSALMEDDGGDADATPDDDVSDQEA